ncbi:MAG: hypothetical protein V1801_01920 [Candidatus Falkowbacteria bacterium]
MAELNNFTYARLQKLAVIVFVCCIIVLFLSGFDTIKSKARDVKRQADIKVLTKALDLHHDKHGEYPDSINDWQGWDLSIIYNGGSAEFINKLKEENFIDRETKDPINDFSYHYRYQKFQAGDYGCENSFYILQIVNFELSTGNNGRGECPELNWAEMAPNGYTAQGFD